MAFVKVATVQELSSGLGKQVVVNGRTLALFNVDGAYYAIDDACPHRGGSLAQGDVGVGDVGCPWHGARFSLSTGENLCPPASKGVKTYPVQVEGDEIRVDV